MVSVIPLLCFLESFNPAIPWVLVLYQYFTVNYCKHLEKCSHPYFLRPLIAFCEWTCEQDSKIFPLHPPLGSPFSWRKHYSDKSVLNCVLFLLIIFAVYVKEWCLPVKQRRIITSQVSSEVATSFEKPASLKLQQILIAESRVSLQLSIGSFSVVCFKQTWNNPWIRGMTVPSQLE